MKNLRSKPKNKDVQLHIVKAFEIINEHIPVQYVDKVINELPKGFVATKHTIRNVRRQLQKPERHLEILTALYNVCLNEQKAKNDFFKNLKL